MHHDKTFGHATGRTVRCGDAEIYVEEIGDRQRPALLLLHGGFGTIEDFNGITPALCSRFRLIGIDSRGHGRSTLGASRLSYALLADDLAQVIDSLALKEFSLFGFSDGGVTAYRHATGKDPRLHKIVTVGASWEMSESDPVWPMISGMTGDIWKDMFPASHHSYMRLNPAPDYDRFAASVLAMWTDLTPAGHPGELMRAIDNEMLIIRGDDDPLTTLDSMARLRAVAENMRFLNIPFAEHVAFNDAPDIFLRAVDIFFDGPLA